MMIHVSGWSKPTPNFADHTSMVACSTPRPKVVGVGLPTTGVDVGCEIRDGAFSGHERFEAICFSPSKMKDGLEHYGGAIEKCRAPFRQNSPPPLTRVRVIYSKAE